MMTMMMMMSAMIVCYELYFMQHNLTFIQLSFKFCSVQFNKRLDDIVVVIKAGALPGAN